MSEQGRYFGIPTWIGRGRWPDSSTTQEVKYVKGFRTFISRGNLIDLAVAVVIGTAFTAVVTAIVADLITPLIAAIGGQPNFANLTFTLNKSTFKYGALFNALISFLIIAAVVYYLIVAPMAKVTARFQRQAEVTTRDCPECLSTIPIAATRCMYCTVQVSPVPAIPQEQHGRPVGQHRGPGFTPRR
jgi:large conductance mechanosensitive channel